MRQLLVFVESYIVDNSNKDTRTNMICKHLPFVILRWAADAFFWLPDFGDSPSFLCCFKEYNLIIIMILSGLVN